MLPTEIEVRSYKRQSQAQVEKSHLSKQHLSTSIRPAGYQPASQPFPQKENRTRRHSVFPFMLPEKLTVPITRRSAHRNVVRNPKKCGGGEVDNVQLFHVFDYRLSDGSTGV